MAFLPDKCQLPGILRERHIEPVDFYTEVGWTKQQYSAYANNRKHMSSGTQYTVAYYLGVPMEDIYSYRWVSRNGERPKQSKR